jgi:hypothetical protein
MDVTKLLELAKRYGEIQAQLKQIEMEIVAHGATPAKRKYTTKRARLSAAIKRSWDNKTPEQRELWIRKMREGKTRAKQPK